jgi:DNA-binding IclR family transcriptional regulator
MAGNTSDPRRSAAHRVLSVLTAFQRGGVSLSLSEVAEHAQLPLSTTHRLVGELVEWGLVTRTGHGRYQLGLRVWEMGQQVGQRLRETARPFVHELRRLTGETSQLAIRAGREVLYIERAYAPHRVPRASRVGGRLPLNTTAVGKVILAHEPLEVQEELLSTPFPAVTERTVTDPERLRGQLQHIREQGHCITVEEIRLGACSIAVPVFHRGRVGAALGLVVSSERAMTLTRHLPALTQMSSQIEAATRAIPLETLWQASAEPHD